MSTDDRLSGTLSLDHNEKNNSLLSGRGKKALGSVKCSAKTKQ